MCLVHLRLAVLTVVLAISPIASASKNPLQRVASSKAANSLWQGAARTTAPFVLAASILLSPPSLDALPAPSAPNQQIPLDARQEGGDKEYVGKAVFFEVDGVGQQGVVEQVNHFEAHIHQIIGVGEDGVMTDIVVIPVEQIEAKLSWPYEVIGNFVAFVPESNTHGLDTETVDVPQQIGVSEYGRLNIDHENAKQANITLGTVAAVTDDGRYVIKPYHLTPFAPDPHLSNASAPIAHRDPSPSSLEVKHFHHLNTGLHLVSKENIISGLEQVLLEETEISEPFFAFLARDDRKREANFAAQEEGLPLPYQDVTPPLVSEYQTTSHTATDFVDKIIYYYDNGKKYLAHAVDQHEDKVVVLLSGGKNTKHIAVEQIRAASYSDGNIFWTGNSISFFGANAFPLSHTVHWNGLYLPGARSGIWEEQVVSGAIVTALDNELIVVKVLENSVNGIFVNYQLYLLLPGELLLHYGNHHHRTDK